MNVRVLLAACLLVSTMVMGAPRVASATAPACVLPYTFTAGQTLPAAQLNADFAQAAACAGPVVYVDAYSPHGDGITPDDTAFNAAQNALPAGGGTIVLGNATYALTGPFLLKSNVTLAGQGPRASVIVRAGGTDNVLIAVTSVGNVTIRDLGITGVNIGTHDNIRVTSSSNVKIDDVDSYQSKGNGVTFVTNTDDASATRSGVYNSRLYSNAGQGAGTGTGFGVAFQAVKHLDVVNDDIYGNYQGGLGAVNGTAINENGDIAIRGNRFSANVANGIWLPAVIVPAAQTTTTGSFAVPAVSSSVTVPLTAASGFSNTQTIMVSDGTHAFTGTITSGGGTTSLVVSATAINLGSAGQTMASGATVGYPRYDPAQPYTNGVRIEGNSFRNHTSGYAIQAPVWHGTIANNDSNGDGASTAGGAFVFQGRYLTITGNVIANSAGDGIDLGNSWYVTCANNQIHGTAYFGIELGSTKHFAVTGNNVSAVWSGPLNGSLGAAIVIHDDTTHYPWQFFYGGVADGVVADNTVGGTLGTNQQYGVLAQSINGAGDVASTVTVRGNSAPNAGSVLDVVNQTNARFTDNNDRNSGLYSVDQYGALTPASGLPAGFGGRFIQSASGQVALGLGTYAANPAWLLFENENGTQDGYLSYLRTTGLTFGVQGVSKVVLDPSGNWVPQVAGFGSLGLTGKRWANGYIDTLTLTNALGTAYGGTACTAVCWVDLTTGQTVAGIKTFSSPPVMSGASITSATIPNAALVNSTISGVNLGSSLFALTPPSHVSGGTYNGGAAVTWTLDATNANTASTVVARDANGAFTMGIPTLQDPTDKTKQATFVLSGISTATTRTYTFPDVSGNIVTTGDTGTVTNAMLANKTISGVNLGSSLFALTPPSHFSGGTYNGGTAVTWTTDCTSAATNSTLVCRDGSSGAAFAALTATSAAVNGTTHGGASGSNPGAPLQATGTYVAPATGGGIASLISSDAGAINQGPALSFIGRTGNGIDYYQMGSIFCAKQTAAADASYGSYCGLYTTNGAGAFVQAMKWDASQNAIAAGSVQAPSGACTGGHTFSGGVAVYSSTGVPSCSASAGSMFLRSDGSAGARIYINQNGSTTWAAIAGV